MSSSDLNARFSSINTKAFAGHRVVMTGKLRELQRDEAEMIVERAGGLTTGSVSGKTSLLVAGKNAGSKLERVRELGIEIIDEKEFLKRALGSNEEKCTGDLTSVDVIAGGEGIEISLSEITAGLF